MSCKSALYAANTGEQTIALNGVINFGSVVRRYGCNCEVSGGNVVLNGSGYYDITANISFETGAGTTVVALYKDGAPIPGAEVTMSSLADTTYSVCIPAIVRNVCCCESVITAVLSGVAGTVNNAAIAVEKI